MYSMSDSIHIRTWLWSSLYINAKSYSMCMHSSSTSRISLASVLHFQNLLWRFGDFGFFDSDFPIDDYETYCDDLEKIFTHSHQKVILVKYWLVHGTYYSEWGLLNFFSPLPQTCLPISFWCEWVMIGRHTLRLDKSSLVDRRCTSTEECFFTKSSQYVLVRNRHNRFT